jgi:hypothetical protein
MPGAICLTANRTLVPRSRTTDACQKSWADRGRPRSRSASAHPGSMASKLAATTRTGGLKKAGSLPAVRALRRHPPSAPREAVWPLPTLRRRCQDQAAPDDRRNVVGSVDRRHVQMFRGGVGTPPGWHQHGKKLTLVRSMGEPSPFVPGFDQHSGRSFQELLRPRCAAGMSGAPVRMSCRLPGPSRHAHRQQQGAGHPPADVPIAADSRRVPRTARHGLPLRPRPARCRPSQRHSLLGCPAPRPHPNAGEQVQSA